MAKKSKGKSKAQAAEQRRNNERKKPESEAWDEAERRGQEQALEGRTTRQTRGQSRPLEDSHKTKEPEDSRKTRRARATRSNTEKQGEASSKSGKGKESDGNDADDAESDSGDENSSVDESASADDSTSAEISEADSRAPTRSGWQGFQTNSQSWKPPSTFDVDMLDSASESGPSQKTKRKAKKTRKHDRRRIVEEESDGSGEGPSSGTRSRGGRRAEWGSTCEQARIDHPVREEESDDPDYDKIILKFDPDRPGKGQLVGRIRYVLNFRGYLFVTAPSLVSKTLYLERSFLIKGSDYSTEKRRF
jgi:hypothetical protein